MVEYSYCLPLFCISWFAQYVIFYHQSNPRQNVHFSSTGGKVPQQGDSSPLCFPCYVTSHLFSGHTVLFYSWPNITFIFSILFLSNLKILKLRVHEWAHLRLEEHLFPQIPQFTWSTIIDKFFGTKLT